MFYTPVPSISHLTILLSGCDEAFAFSPPFHLCSETIKTGGSSTQFLHTQTLGLFTFQHVLSWAGVEEQAPHASQLQWGPVWLTV